MASGLVLSTIVILFAFTLPNVTILQRWGNMAVFETADSLYAAARKTIADGETFGPKVECGLLSSETRAYLFSFDLE